MCHSVGVTSSTPSIQENKDEVSIENAHTLNKQWLVLRVSYGRVFKAKEVIDVRNIQCKLGDEVIVTNGDFEGVLGRMARIASQQRMIFSSVA